MVDERVPLRLTEFRVFGLFGEFNHRIPMRSEEKITALIAPNGSGKTVCLRLIYALFSRKWSIFLFSEYSRLEYFFSDSTYVEVTRAKTEPNEEEQSSPGYQVTFKIRNTDLLLEDIWSPKINDRPRTGSLQVDRYLPFVTRVASDRWTHDFTGQNYTLQDLVENFGDRIPSSIMKSIFRKFPDSFEKVISAIDCHLIETQRLLIINEQEAPYQRPSSSAPKYAIQEKAMKLKAIITTYITQYAALSQSLDRSFPRRVIGNFTAARPENIKFGLAELDSKRRKLMEVGILDTEGDDPVALPSGPIDPPIARLLSVYVSDTSQKLATLDTISSRVQLFKELIESRSRGKKQVNISRNFGFSITSKDSEVPLDKLSSGEQHQLVLFFELLFELKENALILIDEPELSLHVSWQRRFIADLERIIKLNNFEVVLATHSPQLIGSWPDIVVELGDVDEE